MLQTGKTYEFQTVTFYYVGTVETQYPTHVELTNVTKVYDTGPSNTYYSKAASVSERLPDGVLVQLSMCVTITPWAPVIL